MSVTTAVPYSSQFTSPRDVASKNGEDKDDDEFYTDEFEADIPIDPLLSLLYDRHIFASQYSSA